MSSNNYSKEDITNMLFNSASNTELSDIHSPLFRDETLLIKETEALLYIFSNSTTDMINEKTLAGLKKRNFLDDKNDLSFKGRINALKLLQLEEQCNFIGLHPENILVNTHNYPEYNVLDSFIQDGWIGKHCEGAIVFDLINCSILNVFEPIFDEVLAKEGKARSYVQDINPFKSYSKEIIDQILEFTSSLTPEIVYNTFNNYLEYFLLKQSFANSRNIPKSDLQKYVSYAAKDLSLFLKGIGNQNMTKLATLCLKERIPRKGWPDLILVKQNEFRFIEVKSRDKLHISQLITFPILLENGFKVELIKCTHPRKATSDKT